jgi:hypothetical protein
MKQVLRSADRCADLVIGGARGPSWPACPERSRRERGRTQTPGGIHAWIQTGSEGPASRDADPASTSENAGAPREVARRFETRQRRSGRWSSWSWAPVSRNSRPAGRRVRVAHGRATGTRSTADGNRAAQSARRADTFSAPDCHPERRNGASVRPGPGRVNPNSKHPNSPRAGARHGRAALSEPGVGTATWRRPARRAGAMAGARHGVLVAATW